MLSYQQWAYCPCASEKQNPQSARRNNFPGKQISRWFLLLSEKLSASHYPGAADCLVTLSRERMAQGEHRTRTRGCFARPLARVPSPGNVPGSLGSCPDLWGCAAAGESMENLGIRPHQGAARLPCR